MRIIRLLIYLLFLTSFISCRASTDKKTSETAKNTELSYNIDLIITVYNKFVFAIDSSEALSPEEYFTANALKKLQDDYTFDCDNGPCYAYYALRTEAQDSKPGSDGASLIHDIRPTGDGWYTVSYSDMGWPGKTRIKVVDRKIDDYERLE